MSGRGGKGGDEGKNGQRMGDKVNLDASPQPLATQ